MLKDSIDRHVGYRITKTNWFWSRVAVVAGIAMTIAAYSGTW